MSRTAARPYPPVGEGGIESLPARVWVECAGCLASPGVGADVDAVEWAREHIRKSAGGHTRFRLVSQTAFSVTPETSP